MGFREWLEIAEAFDEKRPYKKRRLGAVTGAAKAARRGGGIASVVNPANLSRPDNGNPSGQKYKGITIAGPDYKTKSKIHEPIQKSTKFLPDPYKWNTFDQKKS